MENTVLGILAHVDAGKTTLTEALLYQAGAIRKLGRVDHRDTFLDTDEAERARGITVYTKQAVFSAGGRTFTLIDTPGHTDFAPEMERCLQVLDYAVLVISAAEGIQPHTETIWELLKEYNIPTLLFLNKADRPGAEKSVSLRELRRKLSPDCLWMEKDAEFLSPETVEELAGLDEELLNRYLDGTGSPEEWLSAAANLVRQRRCFPCFWGSALEGSGVDTLLWGLVHLALPPRRKDAFAARVYQVRYDDKGTRLSFLKITGGSLKVKETVEYLSQGADGPIKEKIDQIRLYSGVKWQPLPEAHAGDVCAVTGLTAVRPGTPLGAETEAPAPFLSPVISAELRLPHGLSPAVALPKLALIEEEEPELKIRYDSHLGEIHLQVMGSVQLEILKELFLRRFSWQVEFGPPRILYKETVAAPVMGYGHYEPLRHYAEVHVRIDPGKPGQGIRARSECRTDDLEKNFQNLILTHILEKEHRGILTGSPLTDVTITLTAGRNHLKHTEGGDFRQATYRAIRQGLEKARSVLLEPWYAFRIQVPLELAGRVISDIQQRQGNFEPPLTEGESSCIEGKAPVSTMLEYPLELASFSKGKGSIQLRPAGYRPCHNEEEVIRQIAYDKDQDMENPSSSIFCSHGAGFEVKWQEVDQMRHIQS